MLTRSIIDFYDNKAIFITDATGLLGKSVIEKLLRSEGASVAERLAKLILSDFPDLVRIENPKALNKITAFAENVTDVNFGLIYNSLNELLNNVSVIMHAATVRFYEPLKLATEMNVMPVIKPMETCHQMKNLEIMKWNLFIRHH